MFQFIDNDLYFRRPARLPHPSSFSAGIIGRTSATPGYRPGISSVPPNLNWPSRFFRNKSGCYLRILEFLIHSQVLSGREEVFDELESLFETWYQRMITQLTFVQPTISATSLAEEAVRFKASFQGEDEQTSLDSALMAILRKDTRKVFTNSFHCYRKRCLMSHLSSVDR